MDFTQYKRKKYYSMASIIMHIMKLLMVITIKLIRYAMFILGF